MAMNYKGSISKILMKIIVIFYFDICFININAKALHYIIIQSFIANLNQLFFKY